MSTRRRFISQSAAIAATLAFPLVGGAQPKSIKVGVLHPVTGALAYSGQQCRLGAEMVWCARPTLTPASSSSTRMGFLASSRRPKPRASAAGT